MALNMIALVLVIAITFMHSMFGFYSGLINVFCTLTSAAVALGFTEWATGALISATGLNGSYLGPCVLFGLFVLTLTVLRTAADNLIRGNVHVPSWLDWAGGGVCGFVNAQATVGITMLAITSLPLGGTVLQYQRYSRVEGAKDYDYTDKALLARTPLWTRSIDMTVGMFNLMSSGSLSARTPFTAVYPNYADAAWFASNTVQPGSTSVPYRDKGDGFTKGVNVEAWWWQAQPLAVRYRDEVPTERNANPEYRALDKPLAPAAGRKLLGVRLKLNAASADRERSIARHIFRPTMIRLVGDVDGRADQYVPLVLGGADERLAGANRLVDHDNNFALEGDATIDAYFDVLDGFKPRFIEYRRYARAAMGEPAENAPGAALALETGAERAERERAEAVTFQTIAGNRSQNTDLLPFDLSMAGMRRAGTDVEFEGTRLKKGRVYADVSTLQPQGDADKAEGIAPPAGLRVVQVRWAPKEVRSLAGQVLNFTSQLNQYEAVDDRGDVYRLAGYFGVVKRNNQEFLELFVHGDPAEPGYNNMLDFKNLDRQEIYNGEETQVGLIFFVKPGVTIVRVRNQTGDGEEIRIKVAE